MLVHDFERRAALSAAPFHHVTLATCAELLMQRERAESQVVLLACLESKPISPSNILMLNERHESQKHQLIKLILLANEGTSSSVLVPFIKKKHFFLVTLVCNSFRMCAGCYRLTLTIGVIAHATPGG